MARSNKVSLSVRQQPLQALVTAEHKEKVRKPVDPPPILQVKYSTQDPEQANWLVNPFLFVSALLVEADAEDGVYRSVPGGQIIGQNVSSLHRLKDVDNKDGGFFVFGDISCRRAGTFRLQFSLFDYDMSQGEVVFITSTVSEKFNVVTSKDFRGLTESTHLSRTFSDQGVRLRLRKEARQLSGSKRSYGRSNTGDSVAQSNPSASTMGYTGFERSSYDPYYSREAPAVKRQRSENEYGSQMYSMSPYTNQTISHYTPTLHSSGAYGWSGQPQNVRSNVPAGYSNGLAGQSYSQAGDPSSWQRPMQLVSSHTPTTSTANSSYFAADLSSGGQLRSQTATAYPGLLTNSHRSRTSDEVYPAVSGLQTPSSLPGSGSLSSHQPQGFLSSAPEYGSELSSATAGSTHSHHYHDHHDAPSSQEPYGMRAMPMQTTSRSYYGGQTPHSYYAQPLQAASGATYGQDQLAPLHSLGSDHSRQEYASSTHGYSEVQLPLDSHVINRGFGGYNESSEYDFRDMPKSQTQAYPTPNQTSPA